MPFNLNFPTQNTGTQELQLEAGEVLFVLGANGTGKSSLMFLFNTQYLDCTRKISAHRQTWMNSDALDMTPSTKVQTERHIQNEDRNQQSRYRDTYAAERASMTIYELVDAENVRARAMAAAYDADDMDRLKKNAEVDAPITVINELLHQSNLPITITIEENERVMASKNNGPEYSAAELSDGERNALLIAGSVLTARSGTLLIIDEPDRHLHQKAIVMMSNERWVGARGTETLHWLRAFGIVDSDGFDEEQIAAKQERGLYAVPYYSVEAIYFHPCIIRKIASRQTSVTGGNSSLLADSAISWGVTAVKGHTVRLSTKAGKKAVRKSIMEQIPNDDDLLFGEDLQVTNDAERILSIHTSKLEDAVGSGDWESNLKLCPVRESLALDAISKYLGFRNRQDYQGAVRHMLSRDTDALRFVRSLFGDLGSKMSNE